MALQTEIWVSDIQDKLFSGIEFVRSGKTHDAYVANKTVHIPQSGANPTVTKDRSSYPATISQRTDTDLTYSLSNYDTAPTLITDIDEIQNSYEKRASVLSQHVNTLRDRIGDECGVAWAAATEPQQVVTSGSAGTDALAPGATGNRNALDKADVRKAAQKLDNNNVPMSNRYLVVPTDMYYQLFSDTTLISRDYMEKASQEAGVITELYGFKIMIRPVVAVADNAYSAGSTPAAIKAVGAATATTDNLVALAFQSDFVASALGSVKVFANADEAAYYGSIFSTQVQFGSAKMRTDEAGVVSIVQA